MHLIIEKTSCCDQNNRSLAGLKLRCKRPGQIIDRVIPRSPIAAYATSFCPFRKLNDSPKTPLRIFPIPYTSYGVPRTTVTLGF